jgi:1,4-alpha-glucan branching enzyme
MRQFLFFLIMSGFFLTAKAQVISYSPAYPNINDSLEIIFNATQGNAALTGVNPVYIHTGVITSKSVNDADWQYKKTPFAAPDSTVLMQSLGNNLFRIKFKIRNWYGFSQNEKVVALAMVFRNFAGTQIGKNADGTDIFIPIFETGFSAKITAPVTRPYITTLNQPLTVRVAANQPSFINLFQNGQIIAQQASTQLLTFTFPANQVGKFWVKFIAESGVQSVRDSIYFVVRDNPVVQDPPSGLGNGINEINDSTVILCLLAPFKNYAYLLGDFNNWEVDPAYYMKRSQNGERYWLEVTGLTPGQEVRFQYFVDGNFKIADPLAEKVLDPNLDASINPVLYPNLIPYPAGKTTEVVSVMQPGEPPFNWQITNFQKPDNRDLVIYELLIRDFASRHTFKVVRDSLGYLKKLGINAIQLMPVTEFDGNESWGYGPNFFFAPDKTYGPKEELKKLIDAAHAEGMAVILDIVLNHMYGLAPQVRLWQDKESSDIWTNNPYCNVEATHAFNVGYDLNHDSPYVREFCDTVLAHWCAEYKIDGFRFDLSKGFTQNVTVNSPNPVGDWSVYDASRIYNIKRMMTRLWQRYPGTYAILEHFAANDEETELANFGCMLWGKAHTQYGQATMGWPTDWDFEGLVSYQAKGWAFHNLVGFMESHDEERLMYSNQQFGNVNGNYSTRTLQNALQRKEAASAVFYTVPGPKMLWMFGELGYDYSINWPTNTNESRTAPKPIKWDYLNNPFRHKLFKATAALIKLHTSYPAFRTSNYDISAFGTQKQVYVSDPSMNCIAITNFDMVTQNVFTGFQHTGLWYDYMTGQSLNVTDVNMTISLPPGGYKVFVDQQIPTPDLSIPDSIFIGFEEPSMESFNTFVSPNPFNQQVKFRYLVNNDQDIQIGIYDLLGREVVSLLNARQSAGIQEIEWDGRDKEGNFVKPGNYFYRISSQDYIDTGKLLRVE